MRMMCTFYIYHNRQNIMSVNMRRRCALPMLTWGGIECLDIKDNDLATFLYNLNLCIQIKLLTENFPNQDFNQE